MSSVCIELCCCDEREAKTAEEASGWFSLNLLSLKANRSRMKLIETFRCSVRGVDRCSERPWSS